MHIIDFYILNYNVVGIEFWTYINVVESLIRFAVPVFFMISGSLLINNHKESAIIFYKKRVTSIIAPYIVISIIYSMGNQIMKTQTIAIDVIVKNILGFDAHYHLWFFRPLIILYLLVPIIRKLFRYIEKRNKQNTVNIGLIIWFAIGIIVPNIINIKNTSNEKYIIDIINYLGYFILGYAIDTYYKGYLKNKYKIFILIYAVSTIFTVIANNAYLDKDTGIYNNYFINPMAINICIAAVSLFIYFTNKELKFNNFSSKVIREIGISSLYIYLLHPVFILIILNIFKVDLFAGNLYVKSLLVIIVVNLATIMSSIILNKIIKYFTVARPKAVSRVKRLG